MTRKQSSQRFMKETGPVLLFAAELVSFAQFKPEEIAQRERMHPWKLTLR